MNLDESRTAHLFACYALLALLLSSAALIRSLRLLTHSQAQEKVYDWISEIDPVLSHSALVVSLYIGKVVFERIWVQAGRTAFVGDRFFA